MWRRWLPPWNCIAPGLIRTDFSRVTGENPQLLRERGAQLPLCRMGEPDDIGGIAVMLASRAGAFTKGLLITVDGSETC